MGLFKNIFHSEEEKEFKQDFIVTLRDQKKLQQELIGKIITEVFYISHIEDWGIEVRDPRVIYVPLGILIIKLDNGFYYEINTDYQTWQGGIFGMLIKRVEANDAKEFRVPIDSNKFQGHWKLIENSEIKSIKWNWKRGFDEPIDRRQLKLEKAEKYILDDEFVPDNLIFEFTNGRKVFFFADAPDEEINNSMVHKLRCGDDEIIIFFDEGDVDRWNIKKLGFEITQE